MDKLFVVVSVILSFCNAQAADLKDVFKDIADLRVSNTRVIPGQVEVMGIELDSPKVAQTVGERGFSQIEPVLRDVQKVTSRIPKEQCVVGAFNAMNYTMIYVGEKPNADKSYDILIVNEDNHLGKTTTVLGTVTPEYLSRISLGGLQMDWRGTGLQPMSPATYNWFESTGL